MNQNEKTLERIVDNLDSAIALAGIMLGIFIIYLSFAYGIHQQDIGIIIFLVSSLYLLLRKRLFESGETFHFNPSQKIISLNNIIFFIVFTFSLWLLYSNLYYRPLMYFIFVAIACTSIALEIMYADKKWTALILFKILIVGIVFSGGLYYEFDSISGVDTWYHNGQIELYIEQAHIVWDHPAMLNHNAYYYYPIFHLLATVTNIITSLNIFNSIFASIVFPSIFSAIIIYLIGQKLINTKVGLLAALIYNVSDYHLLYGAQPIPMSLGFVFYIIIIYLFIGNKHHKTKKQIAVSLFLVTILTHTITTFILFISMLSLFIYKNINKKLIEQCSTELHVRSNTVFLFGVAFLAYWMNAFRTHSTSSNSFFDQMILSLTNSLSTNAEFANSSKISVYSPETYSYFEYSLDHLGYLIVLGFGIVGVYLWLRKRDDAYKLPFSMTMITLFVMLYGFSLMGVRSIIPTRWFAFVYSFLAIISAYAIYKSINLINGVPLKLIILSAIIFSMSFFMITSTISNGDSPIYAKEKANSNAYTASEIVASEWVIKKYDGHLITDAQDGAILFNKYNNAGKLTVLNPLEIANYTGMIVLRTRQLTIYYDFLTQISVAGLKDTLRISKQYMPIYSDGGVIVYLNSS